MRQWRVLPGMEDWSTRRERVTFERPWRSGKVMHRVVLLSDTPIRNEEETLVHELVHVAL